MSQTSTLKRGAAVARRRPTVKATSRRSGAKTQSMWGQLVEVSPFTQAAIDRVITAIMVAMIGIAIVAVAVFAGVPGFVGTQIATVAGQAGFSVKRVEVNGIDRMERLSVYAIALDQHSMAMPLVDLERVRNQLMGYPWIKDARVYRRLPDTLVVDIVERQPAAVWQNNQTLSLIDEEGWVLESVSVSSVPDLPFLIGNRANMQTVSFKALVNHAPSLEPMIASATWVGARRWDVRFQSGETLALPEGEEAAGRALIKFARIDGVQHLLGGRYTRFDMRDPTKFVAKIKPKQARIDQTTQATGASKGSADNGPA